MNNFPVTELLSNCQEFPAEKRLMPELPARILPPPTLKFHLFTYDISFAAFHKQFSLFPGKSPCFKGVISAAEEMSATGNWRRCLLNYGFCFKIVGISTADRIILTLDRQESPAGISLDHYLN